jgi:hypothetical protein
MKDSGSSDKILSLRLHNIVYSTVLYSTVRLD